MTLGIDIGKYKIKIVELEKNNNEVSIKNIDSFMVFDDINKFNLEKITSSQIEACIQDLLGCIEKFFSCIVNFLQIIFFEFQYKLNHK